MRAALHVLATIVVVPYVELACGFVILGHAISGGSLWSFFDTLLAHAVWIVPWGLIAFPCVMTLVALLGVIPRFRRLGAVCLCLLAGASLAILIGSTEPLDSEQWLFLLPCTLVLIVAAWLAAVTRQPSRVRDGAA
jgi:hypothetical protein